MRAQWTMQSRQPRKERNEENKTTLALPFFVKEHAPLKPLASYVNRACPVLAPSSKPREEKGSARLQWTSKVGT